MTHTHKVLHTYQPLILLTKALPNAYNYHCPLGYIYDERHHRVPIHLELLEI